MGKKSWKCEMCSTSTNEIWHYSLPHRYYNRGKQFLKGEDTKICKDCREKLAKFVQSPNFKF